MGGVHEAAKRRKVTALQSFDRGENPVILVHDVARPLELLTGETIEILGASVT
jgi:2-C-methyl-D-erythritol 4-phosphate cytidylyltransferase